MSDNVRKRLRDYLEAIIVAVLLALIVRFFIVSAYKVPTSSMAPTLKPGDFIFAYRLPYGVKLPFTDIRFGESNPQRGEVVVFQYPDQKEIFYVKRIVGLPGDKIFLKNGQLYINDEASLYMDGPQELVADLPSHEFALVQIERLPTPEHVKYPVVSQKKAEEKTFGPYIVPEGQVFVLGDNRDASDDSRYWGSVPIDKIEGRVVFIWLSLDWQQRWGQDRMPRFRTERFLTKVR